MKKVLFPAAMAAVLFTACNNNTAPAMDQNAIDAKVDSIVGERLDELNMEAQEDLDRRIAIEVKPKADSIVEAMKAAN